MLHSRRDTLPQSCGVADSSDQPRRLRGPLPTDGGGKLLSKQETLVAARETLDELSLENRLSIDEMGWPGAAGVL